MRGTALHIRSMTHPKANPPMQINRRLFGLGLAGLALSACGPGLPAATGAAPRAGLAPDLRPVPNPAYDA